MWHHDDDLDRQEVEHDLGVQRVLVQCDLGEGRNQIEKVAPEES